MVVLLWLGLGGNDSEMAAYMGGTNILVNGPLDRCTVAQQGATCDESTGLVTVDGCADEKSIPGWKVNNARVTVEAQWPVRADNKGRTNIIKVGDAGSFSEIHQTVDTVIGTTYTISYDVWSEESETNTANKVRGLMTSTPTRALFPFRNPRLAPDPVCVCGWKAFCTSVDSNGQLIIRAGETQTTCTTGDGFCGTGAVAGSGAIGARNPPPVLSCPSSPPPRLRLSARPSPEPPCFP